MPRYLIEVDHEPEQSACTRAVQVFLASGSHLLTHADWGCLDGVHRAWVIADVDDKAQARAIVPPAFRSQARVVALNQWSAELLRRHSR
jgi:hypothetical protein